MLFQFEGKGRRRALQRRDRKPQRMSAKEWSHCCRYITDLIRPVYTLWPYHPGIFVWRLVMSF